MATLLAEHQLGTERALHDDERQDSESETDGFARQLVSRMREFFELRAPAGGGD
jgi:hypothetical protein